MYHVVQYHKPPDIKNCLPFTIIGTKHLDLRQTNQYIISIHSQVSRLISLVALNLPWLL